jgi:hypothetical protein
MALQDPDPGAAPTAIAELCTPGEVRAQLERLLTSAPFRTSRRCQGLLRHIVERTLAGDAAALKERSLGVDVFRRSPDYDTNADPVVRGTAGEIRKKLAQYYQAPTRAGELQIELRPGSYVPEFHPAETSAAAPPPPAPAPPRWRPVVLVAIGAAAALTLVAAIVLWIGGRPSDLDRFWRPFLDSTESALFCLGQARAYSFRDEVRKAEVESIFDQVNAGTLDASRQTMRVLELLPMRDRYTPLGDALCLARLTSLLEKKGQPYRVRGAASATYTDLRDRPSILIGAFDNEWTLRMTGNMRFNFFKDLKGLEAIRDRDHPEKTDWKLMRIWPDWKVSYDYAVAARAFDTGTDRMVVVAAGITHFGTVGAGEFLSNPQYFAEAKRWLPRDWERKNLEFVLRIPVVQGSSGHPQVLAVHAW